MSNTPYPIDPVLSAISVAYRNQMYIADMVLPRSPVGREEFKWWSYPLEETFRAPDDRVGRRGQVNEVHLTATETTDSTDDYGLEDAIPAPDIDQAQSGAVPPGYSPVDNAVMQLTDYIMINREVRVAGIVFDPANYPTGFKTQLVTNDQWNEYAQAASDPIEDISVGLDACLVRPNKMCIGQGAWTFLARHPKIVKAVNGNEGDSGIARRQQVADLFELDEIHVGRNWLNTAKYGQAATLSRIWGAHCLLFHSAPNASIQGRSLTFGLSAQYGSRISGQMQDTKIGLRGGTRVRVGESLKELIIASRAAYFIQDAV